MTAMDRFERRLPGLLDELSQPQTPDYLDDILARTARMRQRPGWTSIERWLPMDIAARAPVGVRRFPWRAMAAVALIAVLLALAIAAAGALQHRLPPPFGPAGNGSLLYDRGGDIYKADAAGAAEVTLIGGATTDVVPVWSHDGTKFMFLRESGSNAALFLVADADGSHVHQLTSGPIDTPDWFDWSPDGTQLALFHSLGGRPSISIVNADGSGSLRTLTLNQFEPAPFVAWRPPSGGELIVLGHPGGTPSSLSIYAIHPDGTGLRELAARTGESMPTTDGGPGQLSFQDLALSPDGTKIAYWNWEANASGEYGGYTHVLDLMTGKDRRVQLDPLDSTGGLIRPHFSPDGAYLLVQGQTPSRLIVGPSDGSQLGVVIGPPFSYTQEPSLDFSPDGSKVILTLGTQGVTYLIDVKGGTYALTRQAIPSVASWQRLNP